MHSISNISPDSVPSLSATSTSSTLADRVVRELFPRPLLDGNEIDRNDFRRRGRDVDNDEDSPFGSDISVASEGTNAPINNHRDSLEYSSSQYCTQSNSPNQSEIGMFPNCHSTIDLTPKGLATIFNIFDASQNNDTYDARSTANSVNDALTEVASNIDHSILVWERKIDSLEREIATLKGIIKNDSVTILRLKTELTVMQEQDLLSLDLISEQGSSGISNDNEETIQNFPEGIEVLVKEDETKESNNDEVQLRLENELFASQIIENESEIRETRDMMSQIAEENVKLSMELSDLRYEHEETPSSYDIINAELSSMKFKLREIEKKLEVGYFCRCSQTNEHPVTFDIMPSTDELSCDIEPVNEGCSLDVMTTEPTDEVDQTDIEVTIEGVIIACTSKEEIRIIRNSRDNFCVTVGNANIEGSQHTRRLDVVETNCNFCDCLRLDSNKHLETPAK
jgi:hypothetical protein